MEIAANWPPGTQGQPTQQFTVDWNLYPNDRWGYSWDQYQGLWTPAPAESQNLNWDQIKDNYDLNALYMAWAFVYDLDKWGITTNNVSDLWTFPENTLVFLEDLQQGSYPTLIGDGKAAATAAETAFQEDEVEVGWMSLSLEELVQQLTYALCTQAIATEVPGLENSSDSEDSPGPEYTGDIVVDGERAKAFFNELYKICVVHLSTDEKVGLFLEFRQYWVAAYQYIPDQDTEYDYQSSGQQDAGYSNTPVQTPPDQVYSTTAGDYVEPFDDESQSKPMNSKAELQQQLEKAKLIPKLNRPEATEAQKAAKIDRNMIFGKNPVEITCKLFDGETLSAEFYNLASSPHDLSKYLFASYSEEAIIQNLELSKSSGNKVPLKPIYGIEKVQLEAKNLTSANNATCISLHFDLTSSSLRTMIDAHNKKAWGDEKAWGGIKAGKTRDYLIFGDETIILDHGPLPTTDVRDIYGFLRDFLPMTPKSLTPFEGKVTKSERSVSSLGRSRKVTFSNFHQRDKLQSYLKNTLGSDRKIS